MAGHLHEIWLIYVAFCSSKWELRLCSLGHIPLQSTIPPHHILSIFFKHPISTIHYTFIHHILFHITTQYTILSSQFHHFFQIKHLKIPLFPTIHPIQLSKSNTLRPNRCTAPSRASLWKNWCCSAAFGQAALCYFVLIVDNTCFFIFACLIKMLEH
jgi:hypothetical protein